MEDNSAKLGGFMSLRYYYNEIAEYEKALKCSNNALSYASDPTDIASIWNNKGLSFLKLGKIDEAIKHFQFSEKEFPQNSYLEKSRAFKA